jgi:phosphate acetyltransferase
MERLIENARKNPKDIVLAEGDDLRAIQAADMLLRRKAVGRLYLLGDPEGMRKTAKENNCLLDGVTLVNPEKSDKYEEYSLKYFDLRKGKITKDDAFREMKDVITYGCMMVRENVIDGMVGGAIHTTADLIRNAIRIVGPQDGIKTVSSFFIMIMPDPAYGASGVFVYADCGAVPNPDPLQLADITVASAENFRKLVGADPAVALLSFSTKGSAKHPDVDKVVAAVEELKKRDVKFPFDGELQFDAAIIESIGKKKAPGSAIAGKANVLIFPDLDAGNIAYKITERLGKAAALGPLMQGLKKPVNDLSRGCSSEDVFQVAIITQNQC